jgi:eukaryotic-like serine/threonine-protein kinase
MSERMCPECEINTTESTCPQCGGRTFRRPDAAKADPYLGVELDGRYRLDARLGAGGMGAVYRATQLAVNRTVAIKLILPQYAADTVAIKRFHREALATSQLTHPHTIQVFDYGQADDGAFYLVMEYLRGLPLSAVIQQQAPLPEARALLIIRQILQSLSEAHMAGIIHRDVKPQNVMLIDVAGHSVYVKVLDFGITKLASSESTTENLTAGGVVGSPQYMPPEQIYNKNVTALSDIYAVGATLYSLLSGMSPYPGETPIEVLQISLEEPFPPLPAEVEISPDVREMLNRMTDKDPTKRPGAEDILSWMDSRGRGRRQADALGGERGGAAPGVVEASPPADGVREAARPLTDALYDPIAALQESLTEPSGSIPATASRGVPAAAAAAPASAEAPTDTEAAAIAEDVTNPVDAARDDLKPRTGMTPHAPGLTPIEASADGDEWLDKTEAVPPPPPGTGLRFKAVSATDTAAAEAEAAAPQQPPVPAPEPVATPAETPTEAPEASAPRLRLSDSLRGHFDLALGDTPAAGPVALWPVLDLITPDEDVSLLATQGGVGLFELSDGRARWFARAHEPLHDARFSADCARVFTLWGAEHAQIQVIDLTRGETLTKLTAPGRVTALVPGPRGERLLTLMADAAPLLWDLTTGRHAPLHEELTGGDRAAWAPDGASVIVAHNQREARLWRVEPGAAGAAHSASVPAGPISALAFRADGRLLATAGAEDAVRLWEPATLRAGRRMAIEGRAAGLVFSPDGGALALAGRDGGAAVCDIGTGHLRFQQAGMTSRRGQTRIALCPSGRRLTVAAAAGLSRVDVSTQRTLNAYELTPDWIEAVAYDPDGSIRAFEAEDGRVHMSPLHAGGHRQAPMGARVDPRHTDFALSPSGGLLIGYGQQELGWHGDAAPIEMEKLPGRITGVRFTADGDGLLVVSSDTPYWDEDEAKEGEVAQYIHATLLQLDEGRALPVQVEGEGQWIRLIGTDEADRFVAMVACEDGDACVRYALEQNWRRRWFLKPVSMHKPPDPGVRLFVSADLGAERFIGADERTGHVLVYAFSEDEGVETLACLQGHDGRVTHAALTPDGRRAITLGEKDGLRLWDVATSTERAHLRRAPGAKRRMPYRPFVAVHPGGELIALGGPDPLVRLWVPAEDRILRLRGHEGNVRGLYFYDEGRSLLSLDANGSLLAWDVEG